MKMKKAKSKIILINLFVQIRVKAIAGSVRKPERLGIMPLHTCNVHLCVRIASIDYSKYHNIVIEASCKMYITSQTHSE